MFAFFGKFFGKRYSEFGCVFHLNKGEKGKEGNRCRLLGKKYSGFGCVLHLNKGKWKKELVNVFV